MPEKILSSPGLPQPAAQPSVSVRVRQLRDGHWREMEDEVSREVPVSISWSLDGKAFGPRRLWAWPEDLGSLALGHVVLDYAHPLMQAAQHGPENIPAVGLHHTGTVRENGPLDFHVELNSITPAQAEVPALSGQKVLEAMAAFMSAPGLWDGTGCFHRAGMYNAASGEVVCRAEDIGRHNCLDRLAAYCALNSLNPAAHILLISARITASLYAKARRAGFGYMVSQSAVTAASVEFAKEQGVTLIGFCRDRESRLTVFSDTEHRVST